MIICYFSKLCALRAWHLQVDAFVGKAHPIGRSANVYEIGKAIAFLASEDASFITGITFVVDGGVSLGGGAGVDQPVK